jgi:ATP-dependent DNA helicase RecG
VTANEVDRALAAPAADVGAWLLALSEDQWFDRKDVRTNPKDLAKPLVAFANAEGGTIVIGASNGKVEGFRHYAPKINEIRQAAHNFTVPPVRAQLDQVRCINDAGEQDTIIVIRVDPSERVHETHTGECYLRVGDESRRLSFTLRQELEYDKGQGQYDGLPLADVQMHHLDTALVANYRKATGTSLSATRLFQNRSLLTRHDQMTNAGYLLFGDHPQDLFPQAFVRIMRPQIP